VGKPERNRPLGKPKLKWENNTRMDLKGTGSEREEWIYMAQTSDWLTNNLLLAA